MTAGPAPQFSAFVVCLGHHRSGGIGIKEGSRRRGYASFGRRKCQKTGNDRAAQDGQIFHGSVPFPQFPDPCLATDI